jgi:alcohol dehydrogenase (cytochrome c)
MGLAAGGFRGRSAMIGGLLASLALLSAAAAERPKEDYRHPAAKEWPLVGGDWGNSRYSSLDQINTQTVKALGAAWTKKLDELGSRATPVVRDGLMFLTAGAHVYALDPKTGDTVWSYAPNPAPNNLYKGVAVGGGLVYVGLSDSGVIALEEKTGNLIWKGMIADSAVVRPELEKLNFYVGSPITGKYVSGSPTYANGIVVVGMANGDYGIRGRVAGFDAKTGKRLWTFDTIPAPGETGHDSWPQDNDSWQKGGAGVWMTPTVDPELGLVYFGTGNPLPYYAGEGRGGDNLFSDTLVALDLKTGKLSWYFQPVHHDLWEFDIAMPVMFYDVTVDGKPRKGIAVMRDDGYMFLLDRKAGKPIIPVEERAVKQSAHNKTSPTQPYPVGADQIVPNCIGKDMGAPAGFELSCYFDPVDLDRPNVIMPSSAVRVAPGAWDPQTGYFYIPGSVAGGWHRRFENPYFLGGGGPVPGVKRWGVMTALDAKTDKIVWQKRFPNPISGGSGVMATAGGLIFHGEGDGNLYAYDAKTGDELWRFQTGYSEDGPPSTYEIDGEQYLTVVETNATLWTFKLGGKVPPVTVASVAPVNPTMAGIDPAKVVVAGTEFRGRIAKSDQVTIGVVVTDTGISGQAATELDEYQFRPSRTKVPVGTKVTWTNGGKIPHNAAAQDGSWSTGEIAPGQSASVTFAKPGTYTYIDKDNPFVYAELIVE